MKKLCAVLLTFCFLFMPLFSEETETETEFNYDEIVDKIEPEAQYWFTGEEVIMFLQALEEAENDYDEIVEYSIAWECLANEAMKRLKASNEENEQLQIENTLLIGGITLSVGISVCGAIVWAITSF